MRFWNKVKTSASGCWLWLRAVDAAGYGRFWFDGRNHAAHRIAYMLSARLLAPPPRGEPPHIKLVKHRCGNRLCVNPHHLYLGTAQHDEASAQRAGTYVHGENHHQSKLTAEAVRSIRSKAASGHKLQTLAMAYGVTKATISHIVHKKTWKHL